MSTKRKLLILAGAALGIHVLLFLACRAMEPQNKQRLQLSSYDQVEKVKLLLMGDSHTERSIDVTQLDSAFSLAHFGENNVMNYYKLSYCLRRGAARPQYVVLPCDVVTFSKKFHYYRTNKVFYYSLIPLSEVKHTGTNAAAMYYDYLKVKLLPYTEWQYVLNLMEGNRQKKANLSFADRSPEERKKEAAFFITQEIMEKKQVGSLFYRNALDYLSRTIALCEANHIKPIFVKFPLTQNALDEVKLCIDSASYADRPAERIIREKNIPILDFETLYSAHPEFFFDSHHLNSKGKSDFTLAFRQKIDSLLRVY